jgi:predicted TIM-barrel fold metal-dependent hydrolase
MISCAAPDPNPRPPRFAVPEGAVDCHAHIFGPAGRYPYATERSYTPPDAPLSAYRRLLKTLGVARGVLVQPSVYGFDNSCLVDGLREAGPDFRGVAVVDPRCDDAELRRLHAMGVRGLRFNAVFGGDSALAGVRALAARVKGLGWHVQLFINVARFRGLSEFVRSIDAPVIVDHMGHAPAGKGVEHPGFREFVGLLRDQACWVKLSGAYRLLGEPGTRYGDVTPFARALVEAAPARCVWATDWPHPQIPVPMPNDGDLMDLLADWVQDEGLRRCILVDNPARLYGY